MRSLADSGIHRENWARAEWTDLDDQFLSWIVDLSRNPRLRVIVDSQADQIYGGLAAGDVIYSVNRTQVLGLTHLRAMIDGLKTGDPVVLQLERRGELMYLAFTVE